MKHVLALLCLSFAVPAQAVLLALTLAGDAEIGSTPSSVVPFGAAYQYRGSPEPPMARFADLVSPGGTMAPDYFLGTGSYGGAVSLFPPSELDVVSGESPGRYGGARG